MGPITPTLLPEANGEWVRYDQAAQLLAKVERSRKFTEQWYAERIERLTDLAKEHGIWDEMACILANGTAAFDEPPSYARQLNMAKARAAKAEKELAEAKERAQQFHDEIIRLRNIMGLLAIRLLAQNRTIEEVANLAIEMVTEVDKERALIYPDEQGDG